jgi:hypothetical protein
MMTAAKAYESMWFQLSPLFGVATDFCERRGFRRVEQEKLGWYPRVQFEMSRDARIWIELGLGLDERGGRFEQVTPDVPMELGVG